MRLYDGGIIIGLVIAGILYFSGAIDHKGSTAELKPVPKANIQTNIEPSKLLEGVAEYTNFN